MAVAASIDRLERARHDLHQGGGGHTADVEVRGTPVKGETHLAAHSWRYGMQDEPVHDAIGRERLLGLGRAGDRLDPGQWTAQDAAGGRRGSLSHGGNEGDSHGSGLVMGSTVYGVLSAFLVDRLGDPWLGHGQCDARFLKPIFEGETLTLGGEVAEVSGSDADGTLAVDVWIEGGPGDRRATARASVSWPPHAPEPFFAGRAFDSLPAPSGSDRTGADLIGTFLAPTEIDPLAEDGRGVRDLASGELREGDSPSSIARYLEAVGVTDPRFSPASGPRALLHPGWYVTASNLTQGLSIETVYKKAFPGVHVGVNVTNLRPALAHRKVHVHGRRMDVFEKRDKTFVQYEIAVLQDGTPVGRVNSTSIRAVRQA
jgi:hypothetical protein